VIDDDEANRSLMLTTLAELGFDTDAAADGQAGLDRVQTGRPDLVLTGLKMPIHDGYEVARRVRQDPGVDGPPVIIFSATPDPDAGAKALAAGAAAFLPSPLGVAALQVALRQVLGLTWTQSVVIDAEPASARGFVSPPVEQLEALMQLALAGNMRAIRNFADQLVGADPQYTAFAERLNGLAAGYQSPAILDLVSHHLNTRQAA
jgi:CheY-like chemotaxis protein